MKTQHVAGARTAARKPRFWCAQQGLTATEYAALAAVLIVIVIAALRSLGGGLVNTAEQARKGLSSGTLLASMQSSSSFKLARTDPNPPAREIECAAARQDVDDLEDDLGMIRRLIDSMNFGPGEFGQVHRDQAETEAELARARARVGKYCH